jgi:hypothetical protein
VGLVQAGRHSSALALFFTLSRRPDLDDGPTHLGRVTKGLEILEGAQANDRVLSIRAL